MQCVSTSLLIRVGVLRWPFLENIRIGYTEKETSNITRESEIIRRWFSCRQEDSGHSDRVFSNVDSRQNLFWDCVDRNVYSKGYWGRSTLYSFRDKLFSFLMSRPFQTTVYQWLSGYHILLSTWRYSMTSIFNGHFICYYLGRGHLDRVTYMLFYILLFVRFIC